MQKILIYTKKNCMIFITIVHILSSFVISSLLEPTTDIYIQYILKIYWIYMSVYYRHIYPIYFIIQHIIWKNLTKKIIIYYFFVVLWNIGNNNNILGFKGELYEAYLGIIAFFNVVSLTIFYIFYYMILSNFEKRKKIKNTSN